MVVSVEEVSSSLVREYLSRKGFKRTIACMDEESPRTEESINNRSRLRHILNMEGLYRENKVQSSPLKTLLEMIVKHHMAGPKKDKITSRSLQSAPATSPPASPAVTPTAMNASKTGGGTAAFVSSKHSKSRSDVEEASPCHLTYASSVPETDNLSSYNKTGCWAFQPGDPKGNPALAPVQDNDNFKRREPEKKTSISESTQRNRTNRIRRGMMAGPIASTLQESNKKRQSRCEEVLWPPLRKEHHHKDSWDGRSSTGFHANSLEISVTESDCVGGEQEFKSAPARMQSGNSFETVRQHSQKTGKKKTRSNVAELGVSELVLDDIDDEGDLQDLTKVALPKTMAEYSYTGHQMDQHTAMELKVLLLGSSLNCFSVEWRNQGFTFSEAHDLRYGIVQKKGGPCGVLASIQAFVLKKLLFENTENTNEGLARLRPFSNTRRQCLVLAMAEILWRAGEEKQATVAISSGRNNFTPRGHYKSEGVLEKLTYFTVDNIMDLQLLLEQHIDQFETSMLGCILMTISAILSRSIEKVKEDMDMPTTTLIGAHGYCTQELVNLLLCGRAVSNVFDNDMELDSGNSTMTLLKGIKGHCDVGLLSLFEHYNICKELT
ncbi:probable ubiquitin carboxyl-terminal hydrolase MINDY-4 isoform X2 [Echeneis naucrates]|uniref:probable ubiquitin carboxyl-terminal hydrolase MINDY-4 isoform X2 n=1 Tax=Echeneis naucrates TaxID=173247 RepID=UPI001113D1F1|nr:probable ubiquitin carboxyl-terminal hydrolase MINDY-4 isoform X2 [Echeneis naucrates]